jgi:tetratricopeptide (TPR) repeat protein
LLRATYYFENGRSEQSIRELNKAINFTPNFWEAYNYKAYVYYTDIYYMDFVKAIENSKRAVSLNHGRELLSLFYSMGYIYGVCAGFPDLAKQCYQEALKLDGDTILYFNALSRMEMNTGSYEKAIEYADKSYAKDSDNNDAIELLGYCYEFHGQIEKSLKFSKKYADRLKDHGQYIPGNMHRIGYAYWMNGYKREGEYWFNEQKRYCEELIKKGHAYSYFSAIYDLAAVYAFTGDKVKALENLRLFARIYVCPLWLVTLMKDDPLFESIRNEQEFQQITRAMEAKYLKEHERVRRWMEEQGML